MKKRYPVYMLTAILLMVFTFSPLAYAETIDNSAAWNGREVRSDRDEFGNFIGAVAVLATVASLVSDRDDYYYYRGRRYYRNGRGVIEPVIFIIAPFSTTVASIVTTGITVSVRVAVFTRRPVFTETITGPRDPGTLETTVETRNKRYRDSHS